MINKIKSTLGRNFTNAQGWRTNRKIIVIESDDWGSIRMRNHKSFDSLLKAGIRVDQSNYNRLDSLETKQDLELLCDVLGNHKDHNNNSAKLTANMVMNNPDFEKIKFNDFQKYHRRSFFNSYQYYYQEDLKPLWLESIRQKVIQPQFHAREHLNVILWMRDLKDNYHETRLAFDHNFFGLKTKTSSQYQTNYLAAYRAENSLELELITDNLTEGLQEFEETFGFKSRSFIACNYVWPTEIEKTLLNNGIKTVQTQRGRTAPQIHLNGKSKVKYHYTGQRNNHGQVYTVRNVLFEPYQNNTLDWVGLAMKGIQNAFLWRKPAIISSHRINYAGNMDIMHRDENLKSLDQLLRRIKEKWSDVEFMSTDELGLLINN